MDHAHYIFVWHFFGTAAYYRPSDILRCYGQITAPPYNFSNINTNVYIFVGGNDWLTTPVDTMRWLHPQIKPGVIKEVIEISDYNHIDFVLATDVADRVICTYKDAFIMFSNGFFTSRVSIMLFGVTFSQTMPLLVHLFIYRLIATKWTQKLSFYTPKTCFLIVAITLGVEWSVWFGNSYINYAPDKEFREYVQPFLDDEFNGEGWDFQGALYYNDDGLFGWRGFIGTMFFNISLTFFMSIIIFCSFSIAIHFRNANIQWSGTTKRLQQQLFYTLLVQTMVPMIFVCFPCGGIINLPLLGFRLNVFPNLVSASLTIFPLIDAFIIMIGVKSYRQALFNLMRCRREAQQSTSTPVVLSR